MGTGQTFQLSRRNHWVFLAATLVAAAACGPKAGGVGPAGPDQVGVGDGGNGAGGKGGNDKTTPARGSPEAALADAQTLELESPPKLAAARAQLEQAHRAAPAHRGVAVALARLRTRFGDAAGARKLLATPAAAKDLTVDERVAIALAYRDLREAADLTAGRAVVSAGLTVDPAGPDGASADRRLAVLEAELATLAGDGARAHAVLEGVLAREPKDAAAWAALTRLLLAEGKPGGARYVANAALVAGVEGAQLREARGLSALAEGDPAAAAVHLRKAMELDPRGGSAAARLGMLRLDSGDAAGAVPPLAHAAAVYPHDVDLRLALAAARRLSGDAAGAATALEEALAIAPDDPRALYAAGKLYDETLDQPARALERYTRYVQVKGDALPADHPVRGALEALKKRGDSK